MIDEVPTLDQLRALVALEDKMSFTHAARRLGMAQSSVSRQIQALERLIGCPLVLRDNRNVQLTRAGLALALDARRLLAGFAGAAMNARALSDGGNQHVNIVFSPAAGFSPLRRVQSELRGHLPGTMVNLREVRSAELAGCVRSGEADLAIGPPAPALTGLPGAVVGEEALVIAGPADLMKFYSARPIHELIESAGILLYSAKAEPHLHALVRQSVETLGSQGKFVHGFTNPATMLCLLSKERAIAFVPESYCALAPRDVSCRHFEGGPAPKAETRVSWSDADLPEYVKAAVAVLSDPAQQP